MDSATNSVLAPDTFMVGHKVKPTADPLVWRLQIGFKKQCYGTSSGGGGGAAAVAGACNTDAEYGPTSAYGRPLFRVVYKNEGRGQWRRRNRAVTKWEIKAVRDRTNLRLCWNYDGSNQNNFVAELGYKSELFPPLVRRSTKAPAQCRMTSTSRGRTVLVGNSSLGDSHVPWEGGRTDVPILFEGERTIPAPPRNCLNFSQVVDPDRPESDGTASGVVDHEVGRHQGPDGDLVPNRGGRDRAAVRTGVGADPTKIRVCGYVAAGCVLRGRAGLEYGE